MQTCPRCGSSETIWNGTNGSGTRRRLCRGCGRHYTRPYVGRIAPEIKQQALQLYLEGMGFRAIGRTLKISNVTVLNWVRAAGERLEQQVAADGIVPELQGGGDPVHLIELDELQTFVQKKTTASGCGLRITVRPDTSLPMPVVAVTIIPS